MEYADLRIDSKRLAERLAALGRVGALEGGGCSRLALSAADKAGRDLVTSWMSELELEISVDRIGNVVGVRAGREEGAAVMCGSHIDTVATGGLYDGSLGVLAALEVAQVLRDAGIETRRPYAVAFFTNEEGARFAPDMMGSGVHQGALELEEMLAVRGIDGASVGDCLRSIGYMGELDCGAQPVHAYLELHVEQGPVLEREGIAIGVVEGVQGISWQDVRIEGVSNHAGTTPMDLRSDPALAAAKLTTFLGGLARRFGGDQVATVGVFELTPNLINVIPASAHMTIDVRNTDEEVLCSAEREVEEEMRRIEKEDGVKIQSSRLARFKPVSFDPGLVTQVEQAALALGHSTRRLPSGAGHDAQMFAPNCKTAMVFVPSRGGISHNVTEFTEPAQIEAGANVLLRVLLQELNS